MVLNSIRAARLAAALAITAALGSCGGDEAPAGPSPITATGGAGSMTHAAAAAPGTAGPVTGTTSGTRREAAYRSDGDSGTSTTPATPPGAVGNLAGRQVDGDNSVRLTWNPPLASGSEDTSVTAYTAVREIYDTQTINATDCSSRDGKTICESTFQYLTYDPHTFSVSATNAAGTGETTTISVTVSETTTTTTGPALTARFTNTPTDHDGSTQFTIGLTFSEETSVSYRTLAGDAITATNAAVTGARRQNRGSNQAWTISVQPSAVETIALTLPAADDSTCSNSGAVCTADGRAVSADATRTIPARVSAPGAVRNLHGAQVGTTNALTATWNPPLRNGAVDSSVTHYVATREGYETKQVGPADGCSSASPPVCSVTYDALTYDPHTVIMTAFNSAGRGESSGVSVNVREALAASFSDVPASHDGTTSFRFKLTFSENLAISYRTLRDEAFRITGGEVTGARRANRGSNIDWWITVQPNRYEDVDITLPGSVECTSAGAICTADGRQLSADVSATVEVVQ